MHVGLPENMVNHIKDLEPSKGRAKAEELVVGFNYAQTGAEMARRWQFPLSICHAVEYHYNPLLAKEFSVEAALIHLAIALAAQSDVGMRHRPSGPPRWPSGSVFPGPTARRCSWRCASGQRLRRAAGGLTRLISLTGAALRPFSW